MYQLKNSSILVIGGTGFIGINLIKKLLTIGAKVTCLSLKSKKETLRNKNLKYIFCDYENFKVLKKKVNKPFDYVINLGGYINHSKFFNKGRAVIDNHFLSTMNLILSIKRKKLKKYLHVGTCDEYGENISPIKESYKEDPITSYAFGKLASIKLLIMLHKTENFPSTILRFFLVYGPHQKSDRLVPQVINGCLSKKNFPVSKGNQLRDFCYVGDVVNAIMLALIKKKALGEIFNVGSGKPISVKLMISKISKIIKKGNPQFNKIPFRKNENLKLYPSINKIKRLLQWKPKTNLDLGLVKTIDYYRSVKKR
jgi:nucleoside-diphosphate-sugar epimerase